MDGELLYKQIYEVAKRLVLNKWMRCDINDVVNDAYLRVLEEGKELTFENLKKKITDLSFEYLNSNSESNEKFVNETQSKYCKKCNEDKPIGAFGITIRKKTGKKIIQTYCSDCQQKIMFKKYRQEGRIIRDDKYYIQYPPDTITKKQRKSYYMKLYRKSNKQKRSAAAFI